MNPLSAVTTLATAQDAHCAGLRAGIGRALDFSRVPRIGFVDRQIAVHQEYQARQQFKVTISTKLQAAINQLQAIAESEHWSQRELAAKVGIRESTFRLLKQGGAQMEVWLPKLETAVRRLALNLQPATGQCLMNETERQFSLHKNTH